MQKRLLLRAKESTSEKWIKENYSDDLIFSLDSNPHKVGIPTTIGIEKEPGSLYTSFIGTLNPLHHPILFLESIARLSQKINGDCVIQFPFWQNRYLYHQILKSTLEILQPTEVYVDHKITLPPSFTYLSFQKISLDQGPTDTFLRAKRRAFWSQFFDQASLAEVSLDEIHLEGTRIGSGRTLNTIQFDKSVLYAETVGTKLFLVSQRPLTSYQKKTLLDQTGTLKVIETPWWSYSGLVCNLQEKSIFDVHLGVIQKIDFLSRMIHLFVSDSVPTPIKYIHLGLLRLDHAGKELEEQNSLAL